MERFKKILKFIGLIILTLTINIVPMYLIGHQSVLSMGQQLGLSLGYLAVASLLIRIAWKRYKKADQGQTWAFTWKDFGIALLFFLAIRVVAVAGTFLIYWVTGNPSSANDAALMATNEQAMAMFPLFFVAFHVAIEIFAPIMEELVFRGFFNKYFLVKSHKWLKLTVSSTIFALLHIVFPIEFPTYFALGAILYLAYARRENIVDSIVVHLLNNSIIIILSVVNYLILMFG